MPSSPAKADDPVFKSVSVHHGRSGILGRPVIPDRVGDRRRAMTVGYKSAFSRQAFARVLQLQSAPSNKGRSATLKKGRREDRVRAAPAVSCALMHRKCAHEHTGSAEAVRPSLRNGFTAYFVLSLVIGLSCHHRHADFAAQLDASVEASGPHDFAVRVGTVRYRHFRVHRIPPQRW